jgi:hypothetical protein
MLAREPARRFPRRREPGAAVGDDTARYPFHSSSGKSVSFCTPSAVTT